jgi:hypothetical protein
MKISTGIIREPHFVLLYGADGIGKTTFAAEAPKPIIVGPEGGSSRINVARAMGISTYQDVVNSIRWLRNEKHDYQSVGIDSLDWIEPLLWKHVCEMFKVQSIEDVMGGFGKGYTEAVAQWAKLIEEIKDLRNNRQMNIIAIAHAHTKTVNDPMYPMAYDRHMLKLNDKASAKWREAVDCVLFAAFEDTVFKVNKGDRKAKADDSGGGNRKIFTVRRAAYDAKNRLGLPAELPLSYSAFAAAADAGTPDSLEAVMADLAALGEIQKVKDMANYEKMIAAVTASANDVNRLIKIRNHTRVLVGEV